MLERYHSIGLRFRQVMFALLTGPQALALLPACMLGAYWLGGEYALLGAAIGMPCLIFTARVLFPGEWHNRESADFSDAKGERAAHLERAVAQARSKSLNCAYVLLELDDFAALADRHGQAAARMVTSRTQERLKSAMRGQDKVFHIEQGQYGVIISPVRHLDMDVVLQIARRIQNAVEEPISVDATTMYASASLGFAISSQLQNLSSNSLSAAADLALSDARRHAPSSVRAYTSGMQVPDAVPHTISNETMAALENGQIQPWYQPQISTETGQVTGFEALARWMHPDRGLISPAEFLPTLDSAGQMERLGEVMLYNAFHALKSWDMQGLDIPHVGVNFSPDELRNPRLIEKIEWELDRFDLTPDRLNVEILENVVATSPDDTIALNINGLAQLGCPIDLDDFGTGHASISSIRRFAVNRLKIDRSFVMKLDQDPEQQRMISAIILMAERLDLATLAEGVETAGEHTMLAQLGCQHVQGFGISRPLPFDKTSAWATEHAQKIDAPPVIGRRAS